MCEMSPLGRALHSGREAGRGRVPPAARNLGRCVCWRPNPVCEAGVNPDHNYGQAWGHHCESSGAVPQESPAEEAPADAAAEGARGQKVGFLCRSTQHAPIADAECNTAGTRLRGARWTPGSSATNVSSGACCRWATLCRVRTRSGIAASIQTTSWRAAASRSKTGESRGARACMTHEQQLTRCFVTPCMQDCCQPGRCGRG
jgi:hypothetical protein